MDKNRVADTKSKIVVIDDDPAFLEMLALILDEEGYEVAAFDSVTFVNFLEAEHPDAVVLDVWFDNEQDGVTLAKAIRQRQSMQETPVFLMSSDTAVSQLASEANVTDFLHKPFNIHTLLDKIESHVSRTH